jgi:hypothetical protein
MKTSIKCVVFLFGCKCTECGTVVDGYTDSVTTTITDIIECGIPCCGSCGSELKIESECLVRA